MALYTMVIVNPASAGGATGRNWPRIRQILDRNLERWDNQFTLGPNQATELVRQAIYDGYEQIVVVGGDGTVNEGVNGLLKPDEEFGVCEELINKDIIFSIVHRGTGGDFARGLKLGSHLPSAVEHLSSPRVRSVDLGLVCFDGHDGQRKRRAYLNISSFGLSGTVVEQVNKAGKSLGPISFGVGLLSALSSYESVSVQLTIDEQEVYEGSTVAAMVANGCFFGGGMKIAPHAEVDDGVFDIVLVTKAGFSEVSRILDLYSGRHENWQSVRNWQGKKVVARLCNTPACSCLLDVDGEQPGTLDARFDLLESAVNIRVP